jgi:ArsR family transcriptional regulator
MGNIKQHYYIGEIMDNNHSRCDCKSIHVDRMEKAVASINSVKVIEEMSVFFRNFSDITRLKILIALDCVGEMCVCDIAVALNMTKSAISHQLKVLKNCNLVKSNKVGKEVFYSLADEHVRDIIERGIEHMREDRV